MAARAGRIYAVFQGHKPGLYSDWNEVVLQVKGYKGAKYKSFPTQEEAIIWLRECVLAANEAVDEHIIRLIKLSEISGNGKKNKKSDSQPDDGTIVIYTDGGASPNPGVGGYGIVLQKGRLRRELAAGYQLTTNNRMEMTAVIVALQALKEPSKVIVHTDSKYVVDSISKRWVYGWRARGWKKSDGQKPQNVDLWKQLLALLDIHQVKFEWVKGHSGNRENERCDALVNAARQQKVLLIDSGYEKP